MAPREPAYDRETLEKVPVMAERHRGFELLKQAAEQYLAKQRGQIDRLVFRTRTEINPLEIEYYRGFQQGVEFVLYALPKKIQAEFMVSLAADKEK